MAATAAQKSRPLCVDLDGTLVRTDTLHESILQAVRADPWFVARIPGLLYRGRAVLKREAARRARLDVATLPYEKSVVEFLRLQKQSGRQLILVSGADRKIAQQVAEELRLFERVIASDGSVNLTGHHKRWALEQDFGHKGFDYVGNGMQDIPVWNSAHENFVVNPSWRVSRRLRRMGLPAGSVLAHRQPRLRAILRAIRVHQWVKNLLVFVPVITSHRILEPRIVADAGLAFLAFGLAASAGYVANDLADVSADRKHEVKRNRPFAAGSLPVATGVALIPILLLMAFLIAGFLPRSFTLTLAAYFVTSFLYSMRWKKIPLVDVTVLASLYTARIFAGGAATNVPISPWLLELSGFLFLSLAMAKRFRELHNLQDRGETQPARRGYVASDMNPIGVLGPALGCGAVVIAAVYIHSPDSLQLYRHPTWLFPIVPLLTYWISRVWLLVHRGTLDEDPILFAMKDVPSYVVAVLILIVLTISTVVERSL